MRVIEAGRPARVVTAPGPRYADFEWSPDGRFLVAVEEGAARPGSGRQPENRIVAVDLAVALEADCDRIPETRVVAAGHDFVSFPRFSPDGSSLA